MINASLGNRAVMIHFFSILTWLGPGAQVFGQSMTLDVPMKVF